MKLRFDAHQPFQVRAVEAVADLLLGQPPIEAAVDLGPGDLPAVANRLDVYQTHTVPLVEHYRGRGVLIEIDGEGTIDQVWRAMESAVALQGRMVRT